MNLSKSTAEALLRKAGANIIGESAKEELQIELNKKIEELTKKAETFSNHTARKTIKKEDIILAIDTIKH